MWANSFWGLVTFAVTFGLVMLLLSPDQEWLRPYLQWATVGCAVLSAVVLCWPLRRSDNRAKLLSAFHHPLVWVARSVQPIHIMVLGLAIALIGLAIAGIGLWRLPGSAQASAAGTVEQAKTPAAEAASKAIYTRADIEEMLDALRKIRKIVDEDTRPHAEKTQEIYQQWAYLLMNEGPIAIAERLEAIRNPIRNAGSELRQLMYKEHHFDAELRPAVGDFESAYGWFDSATSMLIDALRKYASADKFLLGDLLKDRYQEWAGGINSHVFQWFGKADAGIRDKTKELREWPHS